MPKNAIVFLADGFEEVEAITPIDYLRRAGIDVCAASLNKSHNVKGSHNIDIAADVTLDSLFNDGKLAASKWDAAIVPGGLPGADNFAASKEIGDFLKEMADAGKLVCAICAAPARVLAPLGLLAGKKFTCYPGEEAKVLAPGSASPGAEWKEDRVTVDANIITSRGAGTAGEFACAIIAKLVSEDAAAKLAEKVLLSAFPQR